MNIAKTCILTTIVATTINVRANTMIDHISEAHNILHKLKKQIEVFSDKDSYLTLNDHIDAFSSIVAQLDVLISEVQKDCLNNKERKYLAFFKILRQLESDTKKIKKVLEKDYMFFGTFALACKKLFKHFSSNEYQRNITRRVELLKEKINTAERKELDKLIGTLISIPNVFPGKWEALKILHCVWHR